MSTDPRTDDTDLLTRRRQTLTRLTALCGLAAAGGTAGVLSACGGGGDAAPAPPVAGGPPGAPPPPPPPSGPPPTGPARTTTLTTALASPWGMAFLPDGRALITEKGGTLRIATLGGSTATLSGPVAGVPVVVTMTNGQGGLLDVALDPDFATDPWVYLTYVEGNANGDNTGTAVGRGRLSGTQLVGFQVIYQQTPKVNGDGHFGSRLAFRSDGTLFVSLGERTRETPAQDLTGTLGKVVRINRNGSIPSGNPSLGAGARPEIWSYGHRNPQGAAVHPTTGDLWLVEHGPQGGDELNRVVAGGNFGWPNVSYGCPYGVSPANNACRIGGGVHSPGYVEPVSYWPPQSIAPSGLMFYTGAGFPEWQGNAMLGALAGTALWRVALNGATEVSRERLFGSLGQRIRCVKQGPDGWIYLLTDSGRLVRIDRT